MIFVFDLDDTICDTDGYSEKYILNFFKENNLPYKQIAKQTRYAETKFDWDEATAIQWYKTIGDDMMAKFPCKDNNAQILRDLYNEGNTIIIATARDVNWHGDPEGVTKKWLIDNNIPYHKLYVGRVDKELICEAEKADVFIDDDILITAKVAEHNKEIKVYLAHTDYNKNLQVHPKVKRIKGLKELIEDIKENENV